MGLVVTVDGSWEISDRFLVIWYNMKCDVFGVRDRDALNITRSRPNKISREGIFL